MLLTLSSASLHSRLSAKRSSPGALAITDLPRFARDELDLYGLYLETGLFAGADSSVFDDLRDAADKSGCPCLVLVERAGLRLGSLDDAEGEAAVERLFRVLAAAGRLGCNSIAVPIEGPDDAEVFDFAVERIKRALARAERAEVNLLFSPHRGLTESPDRLTDLIKKVGGFRIGTYPDFEAAGRTKDPLHYLKRVVPYASAICASSLKFTSSKDGEPAHQPYDLAACVETVESVGYSGTLGIEYRGKGDPVEGVLQTKRVLELALGLVTLEDQLLDELGLGDDDLAGAEDDE